MTDELFKFYKDGQLCESKELTEKFSKFHKKIVNEVIQFCKENNLDCDAFSLWTTGIKFSQSYGYWTPGTDSSCSLYKEGTESDDIPFLNEI